jgi:predicted nucleic acid-binding protein
MEKGYIMCDTNIFINWFNNDEKTILKLKHIGLERLAISVITVMELIQGVDNKEQLQKFKKKIKHYTIVNFTKEVSELSLQLIMDYKLSHNLQIPDAIIAATSVIYGIPLFTYNLKDFKYIPEIQIM